MVNWVPRLCDTMFENAEWGEALKNLQFSNSTSFKRKQREHGKEKERARDLQTCGQTGGRRALAREGEATNLQPSPNNLHSTATSLLTDGNACDVLGPENQET